MMEEQQFRLNRINIEEFRQAIVFLQERGKLKKGRQGMDRADGSKVVDTINKGVIYYTSQADGSLFIVVKEDDTVWNIIRDHLLHLGYVIERVQPTDYVTAKHPFVDLSEITKEKHRIVVQLLIDRWLGRNRMTNKEIWEEADVGKSTFYDIRTKYTKDLEMRLQQPDPD